MAQKIIFTQYFRIGPFANLDKPYAAKPTDTAKYGVSALFPKNGITKPTGQQTSGVSEIIAALDEVCTAEFGCDYGKLLQYHTHYGIQYPPQFIDGDQDFRKDDNGNPVIGQVRPESAGMWRISFKNADPVDLVAPNGNENVTAAQMCPGYWARAQISVDAYTNKQNQRVLSIKLLNLQLAYTDEKLASGGAPKQEGTQAFSNMAVGNSNVPAGFNGIPQPGQTMGMPQQQMPNAGVPGMMPQQQMPNAGMPQQQQMPGQMPNAGVPGMMPQQQQLPNAGAPGMPQQQPMQQLPGQMPNAGVPGMMPQQQPNVAPGAMQPGQMPGMPQQQPMQQMPGQIQPPPQQQQQQVQTNCRVIMNPGEHSYEQYRAAGWTDEAMVSGGKAQWNFNYTGQ